MGTDPLKHERYRASGNTLVAILITLSSGILLWNMNLLDGATIDETVLIIFSSIFLIMSILASLFALLSHYNGYKSEARSEEATNTTAEATRWFNHADRLVPGALAVFIIGALLDIVLLIILKMK